MSQPYIADVDSSSPSNSNSENESIGEDREPITEQIFIPNEEPKQYYLALKREIEENGIDHLHLIIFLIFIETIFKTLKLPYNLIT